MNPWAIVAALLLWIASLAGVGYWQNSAGHTAERAAWQKRENQELVSANLRIIELSDKYRAAEKEHAAAMDRVAINREKERENEKLKTEERVRAARAGTLRLRDPGATACQTSGSALPGAGAGTGQRDGPGNGGLSGDAAEFLLKLTGRCNDVRDTLNACQRIVEEDRRKRP